MVKFLDLVGQYHSIKDDIDAAISRVITTSAFIGGPDLKAFESEFAAFQQAEHCIGVANGTDALILVLEALGIGPGDAVICPAFTFAAPAEVIAITGAEGPLLQHATIRLVVETLENTDLFTPTVSRLTQLVVIDILSVAVSLRRDEAHHERIAKMKSRLATLRSTGNY